MTNAEKLQNLMLPGCIEFFISGFGLKIDTNKTLKDIARDNFIAGMQCAIFYGQQILEDDETVKKSVNKSKSKSKE